VLLGIAAMPSVGASATWESIARAQSGGDKVTAEALFEDGRKLVADGKYADACPKFADSERLDPSPSTVLNLASCWERLGKTATAWATYKQAQSEAVAAKRPDYAVTAERHADALAALLARLTILVPQPTEGLQLKKDGVVVGAAEWGAPLPIDAGSHAIEGNAPGYKKWSTTVDIPHDGARITVTVPALEPVPPAPPAAAPASTPAEPIASQALAPTASVLAEPLQGSSQRTAGIVVGASGLVVLGVSGVLAGIASIKNTNSNHDGCSGTVCSNDPAFSERNDAVSFGNASTVTFAIGAAGLVGGLALWLFSPKAPDQVPAARWVVAPTIGGAVARGVWQ
jgi:hypothetical protein